MFPVKLHEDALTPLLIDGSRSMILNGETVTYKQLSLFDLNTEESTRIARQPLPTGLSGFSSAAIHPGVSAL